jgi:nitrite reductase/ring-hydroxylating ferredoxin subunit
LKLDLGPLDSLEEGRIGVVSAAGREIAYVRQGDSVFAFRNVCPHQSALLSLGSVARRLSSPRVGQVAIGDGAPVVRCPWHSWEFDLRSGRSLQLGDRYRFAVYRVEIVDGRVQVSVRSAVSAGPGPAEES